MLCNQVNAAAMRGCREGILDGATIDTIRHAISNDQSNMMVGIRNWTVEVTPTDPTTAKRGELVTVTISARYADNGWLPVSRFFGDRTISATHAMYREAVQ